MNEYLSLFKALERELSEKVLSVNQYITSFPLEHLEYVHKVGELKGLKEAEEITKELFKRVFPDT